MRLKDKVAIITGGGTGIGKGIAQAYADEGAAVVVAARDASRLEETVKQIKAKGGKAIAIPVDIGDEAKVKALIDGAVKEFGKIDILVNNAAIWAGLNGAPWDVWSVEEFDRMFQINVRGNWSCCKYAVPVIAKQGKGKIINIASDIARAPAAQFFLPYACSKGAVYTMTHALAWALGPSLINVNAIAPGYVTTEASLAQQGSADTFVLATGGQAIHRRENVSDLTGAAVFLGSEESDFITGQVLFVSATPMP